MGRWAVRWRPTATGRGHQIPPWIPRPSGRGGIGPLRSRTGVADPGVRIGVSADVRRTAKVRTCVRRSSVGPTRQACRPATSPARSGACARCGTGPSRGGTAGGTARQPVDERLRGECAPDRHEAAARARVARPRCLRSRCSRCSGPSRRRSRTSSLSGHGIRGSSPGMVGSAAEYTRSGFRYRNGRLHLAKMDTPLAFVWSWPGIDPATIDPTTVTVSRDPCGRWYVSFAVDVTRPGSVSCRRLCRRGRPRDQGLRGHHRRRSGSPTRGTWSVRPGTWPAISGAWPAIRSAGPRTAPRPRRRSPAPTARSAPPAPTSSTAPPPAWSATTT